MMVFFDSCGNSSKSGGDVPTLLLLPSISGQAVWQVGVVVLRAMGVHISEERAFATRCLLASIMFHAHPYLGYSAENDRKWLSYTAPPVGFYVLSQF